MRTTSRASLLALLCTTAALGSAAALPAAHAGGNSELALTLAPDHGRLPVRTRERFEILVDNRAGADVSGLRIALEGRGGLAALSLVEAPPDTIAISCTPGTSTTAAAGPSVGGCTATATPPRCARARATLTCSYAHMPLKPAGTANAKLLLVISAHTGGPGTEQLLASATGSLGNSGALHTQARARFAVGSSMNPPG